MAPEKLGFEEVIVLCPPHATTACGGPRGVLGDRIHQLVVLDALVRSGRALTIWPQDNLTETLFAGLQPQWMESLNSEIAEPATKVIGLFAMPDKGRSDLTDMDLLSLDRAARSRWGEAYHRPDYVDPGGASPIWKQQLNWLESLIGESLPDIKLPLLKVDSADSIPHTEGQRVILASPLSGGEKRAVSDDWWREFAQVLAPDVLVVPVMADEKERARAMFKGAENIQFTPGDIPSTVSLAFLADAAIGVDGGRLNVIAASRIDKVLGFYGIWPASAWALPNVVTCDLEMTPQAAGSALRSGWI